jgi:copper homeostasis protein (lipoprotein)
MKTNQYLVLILLTFLISCQDKKETVAENKPLSINDFPKVNNNLQYIGTYLGVLPCGDCEGMETKITINENNTYTKSVHYLGKGNKVFEQKGTITWNTLGNVIKLNEIQNSPNQYLVSNDELIQLDIEGNIIEGNIAKEYKLFKQSKVDSEIETTPLDDNKINLNNKLEATASVEKVNPAEGKYTLAETKWKLIKLNGKTVKQKGSKTNFIKMNSSDGKFSAFAGCNNMFGSYAMPSVNTITFSEIGATRMMCPNMTTEDEFMNMLQQAAKYSLDKETLSFYNSSKVLIATFVAAK